MNAFDNLLAFDTSTEQLSVAVQRGRDGQRFAHTGAGGAQASTTLIPTVQALLAQAGLALGELQAIVFGRGPGSFTGLRTACSVAQGLAWGEAVAVPPAGTLLAGNAAAVYAERLPAAVLALPRAEVLPTADALLNLAPALLAAGRAVPADQALPLYIRDKVAQTTAERAAAGLAR